MLSSTGTSTKSSLRSAPDMSSEQEFPGLAPSTSQLDLKPRAPMKPTPLAHIFGPKSKSASKQIAPPAPKPIATPVRTVSPVVPREPRPSRCTNPCCPVTGYHLTKVYTCGDQNLPSYVKELEGRADRAKANGVKNAFNEAQKKLDRFFFWHSGSANWSFERMEQQLVHGPFETSGLIQGCPFETSGLIQGWKTYLFEERTQVELLFTERIKMQEC
ncbi:hypothetical protein G7Y79_00010g028930 [Physcia stellaris]|nr:hypothetical protein G7Y79_00010g028930 [Physcia stellaris]